MANKLKGSKALDIRQSFRADPSINEQFEILVDANGYNKSSVFRKLQELWVTEQLSLQGKGE